ncbi:MAG TPA: FecR domain-containing protein [Caulobacteraceae bacterium]|jgi:transmembrane sensor
MTSPVAVSGETDARAAEAALWSARLAEGPLAAEDHAAFQAWLDADPLNAEAMDEIVRVWSGVEAHAAAPELLELRKRALASAQRGQRGRLTRVSAGPVWGWASLAAALALVVVVAGAWTLFAPRSYATGLGERRVVALSDGSRVSLDAETTVRVRYAFGHRELWLDRGRAKFDVAKDPLRPFTVDAGGREVVATGTSFSVELLHKQVRVVLYEGHVAVLAPGGGGRPAPVTVGPQRAPAERALTPGHELIAPSAGAGAAAVTPMATVAAVDPVRSAAWEGGQLVFEDEPLTTAVARMDRYAATPLVLGDAEVGRVRISGVFRAGDATSFVQGLTAAFPVAARQESDRIVLTSDRSRQK